MGSWNLVDAGAKQLINRVTRGAVSMLATYCLRLGGKEFHILSVLSCAHPNCSLLISNEYPNSGFALSSKIWTWREMEMERSVTKTSA